MNDFIFPFLVITLVVVILIQAVERYFYAQQTQAETSRLIAAIISKNSTEYTTIVKAEKETPTKPDENETVDLSNASDEVFDRFIERQTQ